jgi:hypothetical protein
VKWTDQSPDPNISVFNLLDFRQGQPVASSPVVGDDGARVGVLHIERSLRSRLRMAACSGVGSSGLLAIGGTYRGMVTFRGSVERESEKTPVRRGFSAFGDNRTTVS